MKIPREAMTPALDAALRTFVDDGVWYMMRPTAHGDGPAPVDLARRQLKADAERNAGAVGGAAFAVLGLGFGAMFRSFEEGDRIRNVRNLADGMPDLVQPVGNVSVWIFAAALILMAGAVALGFWRRAVRPGGLTPRADFLAAALDRLDLAPVQRRYAEALAAVYSGRVRDPGGEGLGLLRSLTDEEGRLLALAPTVVGARAPEIDAEAAALRARLAEVRDGAAREALGQSLALAERRAGAAARADAVRERLEAHRSLLDQAAAAATETIFGRGEAAPDLDDLRRNVSSLGREVTALETAIQEMGAL